MYTESFYSVPISCLNFSLLGWKESNSHNKYLVKFGKWSDSCGCYVECAVVLDSWCVDIKQHKAWRWYKHNLNLTTLLKRIVKRQRCVLYLCTFNVRVFLFHNCTNMIIQEFWDYHFRIIIKLLLNWKEQKIKIFLLDHKVYLIFLISYV